MKHQYAYVVRYCGDVVDSPYAVTPAIGCLLAEADTIC